MEFIATLIAFTVKSGWGVIVLVLILALVVGFFRRLLGGTFKFDKKKIMSFKDKTAATLLVLGIALFVVFVINSFVNGKIVRAIVNHYGTPTEAVMYKSEYSGIMLNYHHIDRYYFVFQLPDSTYQDASLLEHHMKKYYSDGERLTIKYLPLTASFYPIIIDIKE